MTTEAEEFSQRNGISEDDWVAAAISWDALKAIRDDYEQYKPTLEETAAFIAKLVQGIPHVHSVRWRVKDPDHLLRKIVRKRAARVEKYLSIDSGNYHTVVTDLVGIRALHLLKGQCFDIDKALRLIWTPIEKPVGYVRKGDDEALSEQLRKLEIDVEPHSAGYRSIHYVIESRPVSRSVVAEIQVRTVFEEGWSEIDHRVRYPDLGASEQIERFLGIFNRVAGYADEMGEFVMSLSADLRQQGLALKNLRGERESALQQIESLINELEDAKKRGAESSQTIASLRREVSRLKPLSETSFGQPSIADLSANRMAQLLGGDMTDRISKAIAEKEAMLLSIGRHLPGSISKTEGPK